MNIPLILFIVSLSSGPFIMEQAFAQTTIDVGETTPCFMNYTAGVDMWYNCGFVDDPIAATLLPFEWVTGGIFSMIVVVLIVIMVYIKYHTVIYPIAIGIMMLPLSFFVFPEQFLSYAFVMAGVGITALVYRMFVKRTNG